MGDSDVAEAEVAQDVQNYANMAIGNYPQAGSLAPYGWALDQAGQEALKEQARVQQSISVLQQAAVIRADETLMAAIRKHLVAERARMVALLISLER